MLGMVEAVQHHQVCAPLSTMAITIGQSLARARPPPRPITALARSRKSARHTPAGAEQHYST
jgi:hypothetical protein